MAPGERASGDVIYTSREFIQCNEVNQPGGAAIQASAVRSDPRCVVTRCAVRGLVRYLLPVRTHLPHAHRTQTTGVAARNMLLVLWIVMPGQANA